MKNRYGFYFPSYDTHFPRMLKQSLTKDGILRYQWRQRDFAVDLCEKKRVCIDIGANVGLWSCDLVKEFDQVLAFEPVEDFRHCFLRNVISKNFTLYPVALGKTESTIEMIKVERNSGHSHVDVGSIGKGSIPLRTLDSYNFTAVDMIKIDVEGYEEEILFGAVDTIKSNRPVLVVEQQKHEYKDDTVTMPAIKILKDWGYEIASQFNKDWVLRWKM